MIKDSGNRTEFETGAVRDMKRGVGRMDLLPWYGIMEVSKHCEEGAEKYGEHNVDKGIPLHSLCDSAARHLAKFIAGETDEDHLRAATWNLLWALNQRKTHPELDDLYSHKEKVDDTKSFKETKNNDIKSEEPTAIEPLSNELLLGMNGRFVYLVQNNNGVYTDRGWVRIRVDGNDIIITKDDEEGNILLEKPWINGETNCYITDPNSYGRMPFMTDPYYLAANKTASKLEMLSKELCTNETINTWCEIVSKTVSEQRDEGQSPEKE